MTLEIGSASWIDACAVLHGAVATVLSVLVVWRYLWREHRFPMVGMAISYLLLTFVNVRSTIMWGRPDSPWLYISFVAWLLGDASLVWRMIFGPPGSQRSGR